MALRQAVAAGDQRRKKIMPADRGNSLRRTRQIQAHHAFVGHPMATLPCNPLTCYTSFGAVLLPRTIGVKKSEKLDLISRIGRTLQERFTFQEIDSFLRDFGVSPPQSVTANSKWVYTKVALAEAPEATVIKIADDLRIAVQADSAPEPHHQPAVWKDDSKFRLFISHLAARKDVAHRLKEALALYHITAFVAHDDILPTKPWELEIEAALGTMDAMLALVTVDFSTSVWTQQEIAYALGRGIKVISFKYDANSAPPGFIAKHQAILRKKRTAEQIAKELHEILAAEPLTRSRMQAVQAMNAPPVEHDDDIPF